MFSGCQSSCISYGMTLLLNNNDLHDLISNYLRFSIFFNMSSMAVVCVMVLECELNMHIWDMRCMTAHIADFWGYK